MVPGGPLPSPSKGGIGSGAWGAGPAAGPPPSRGGSPQSRGKAAPLLGGAAPLPGQPWRKDGFEVGRGVSSGSQQDSVCVWTPLTHVLAPSTSLSFSFLFVFSVFVGEFLQVVFGADVSERPVMCSGKRSFRAWQWAGRCGVTRPPGGGRGGRDWGSRIAGGPGPAPETPFGGRRACALPPQFCPGRWAMAGAQWSLTPCQSC